MNAPSRTRILALGGAALLAGALAAQSNHAELTMERGDKESTFWVQGRGSAADGSSNFGVVILAKDPTVCQPLIGMPALLCDYAILGVGSVDPTFSIAVANDLLPKSVSFYAQGLLGTADALYASEVMQIKPVAK